MTIERQRNGSLIASDIVDGQYVKKVYYGYTKKESKEMFQEHLKELRKEFIYEKRN
jgi:hypothetical protein